MRQKKNKGIIITLIILIIILLLVGAIAYMYFFTDIFKSNKELFFKYTSQLIQTEDGFIENQLVQYFQEKQTTTYENSGNIAFDVSISDLEEETELANDFNITFSGVTDKANNKTEQEISLNYSDSVNLPFTYRKTTNLVGIQTQYIGSSFVAVKTDEEISGFDNLNQFIQLQNLTFSNEDIQNIKTTYFDNILNTLDDSKFSTFTEGDLTGYRLTLTGEELENVLIQMLEALKTDTTTINNLNDIFAGLDLDIEIDENYINDLIDDLSSLNLADNIEINVYAQDGSLSKLDIEIAGNTISIDKETSDQEMTYTVSLQMPENDIDVTLTANYTGLDSDSITETYEITLDCLYEESTETEETETLETETEESTEANVEEETEQTTLTIEEEQSYIQSLITTVKANKIANGEDSTQITDEDIEEELTTGENAIYTDMRLQTETDTTFNITFISTGDRFVIDNTGEIIEEPEGTEESTGQEETTSEQENTSTSQEKTGSYTYTFTNTVQFVDNVTIEDLTDDNAVILNDRDNDYITTLMNAIEERITEVNQVQMEELGVSENDNPIKYLIPSFISANYQSTQELDEETVTTFNAKFELYESTNTKGATVKGLLTTIQNSNEAEETNKIEEINFDGEEYEATEQNITLLKSDIDVDDDYRVEFEKDISTGLIYRAVINKR